MCFNVLSRNQDALLLHTLYTLYSYAQSLGPSDRSKDIIETLREKKSSFLFPVVIFTEMNVINTRQ